MGLVIFSFVVRSCPLCNEKIEDICFSYEIPYKMCSNCDLMFGDIKKTPEYDESSHTDYYNRAHIEYLFNFNFIGIVFSFINDFWKNSGKHSAPNVLDLGCGMGLSVHFGKFLNFNIKGLEISERQANWGKENLGVDIFSEKIENVAFQGHKFDVVYCSEVIEHILNPLEFLKIIDKVLNEEGFLVFTTPNIRSQELGKGPTDPKFKSNCPKFLSRFHITMYSKDSIKKLLKVCNFKNIFVTRFYGPYDDERLLVVASKNSEIKANNELLKHSNIEVRKLVIKYLENNYRILEKNSLFWKGSVARLFIYLSNEGLHKKANDFADDIFKSLGSIGYSKNKIKKNFEEILLLDKKNSKKPELVDFVNNLPAYIPVLYFFYGMNLLNLKNQEEALEIFEDGIRMYEALFFVNDSFGSSYVADIINKANKNDNYKRFLEMKYLKGVVLLNLKQKDEARKIFDEILNDPFIHECSELKNKVVFNKGISLLQMGKYYSAISEFDKILDNEISNLKTEALFHKGLACKYLGEKKMLDSIIEKLSHQNLEQNLQIRIKNELKNS